jgi:hypothetical protein
MTSQDPNKFKATIDADAVALRPRAEPVHKQRFDIRFQEPKHGIFVRDFLPCVSWRQGLHRTTRAGIDSHNVSGLRAMKEESEIDRDLQPFPLHIGQAKFRQRLGSTRNTSKPSGRRIAKQDGTRLACAPQSVSGHFHDVVVFVRQALAAQVASFAIVAGLHQTAQGGQSRRHNPIGIQFHGRLHRYAGGMWGIRGSIGSTPLGFTPVESRAVRAGSLS